MLTMAAMAAAVVTGGRWLRVAQREHYLAPAAIRFAIRWWTSSSINRLLALLMFAGVVGEWWLPGIGWLAVAAQVGPIGLGLRGRTSPLVWTWRLRRLAIAAGALMVLVGSIAVIAQLPVLALVGLVAVPLLVDLALLVLRPIEERLGSRFVDAAVETLRSSGAKVVAVTGSYGKTTTKAYIAHLLSGRYTTVASPGSFNNRMGLARAINEQLGPGTEFFVAEMGAYGSGEIARLCEWLPPQVAVITAIGPVHLERFGSEAKIVEAKREILRQAPVAVINIDHPGLARVATEERGRRRVITCSEIDPSADISVADGVVTVEGEPVGKFDQERVFGINLACAVGAAFALDVHGKIIAPRLQSLPEPVHRRELTLGSGGFTIIDDTFNANPEGASSALSLLATLGDGGRRVVVTPGMVELGSEQVAANRAFAAAAAAAADEVVIVGATNRRALLQGAAEGPATVIVLPSRQAAVDRIAGRLGEGDVVLFENDLPDHYP